MNASNRLGDAVCMLYGLRGPCSKGISENGFYNVGQWAVIAENDCIITQSISRDLSDDTSQIVQVPVEMLPDGCTFARLPTTSEKPVPQEHDRLACLERANSLCGKRFPWPGSGLADDFICFCLHGEAKPGPHDGEHLIRTLHSRVLKAEHHGISVGNWVVHFSAPLGCEKPKALVGKNQLVLSTREEFFQGYQENDPVPYKNETDVTRWAARNRAINAWLLQSYEPSNSFDMYNFFLNNCEHFATWCKTGEKKSHQVRKFAQDLLGYGLLAGLAVAARKAPIGALLFNKNVTQKYVRLPWYLTQ